MRVFLECTNVFSKHFFQGVKTNQLVTESLLKECEHHFQWDTWNLRCTLQLGEFGVLHGFLQLFGWWLFWGFSLCGGHDPKFKTKLMGGMQTYWHIY